MRSKTAASPLMTMTVTCDDVELSDVASLHRSSLQQWTSKLSV